MHVITRKRLNLNPAMEIAAEDPEDAEDADEREFAFGFVWKIALTHWVKGVPARMRRSTSSSSAFSASSGSSVVFSIAVSRLNEFAETRPDTLGALAHWSFTHLRETFPSADLVGKLTVFNIAGNKVRLIAALHSNRQKVHIRAVLTHAEYNTGQ